MLTVVTATHTAITCQVSVGIGVPLKMVILDLHMLTLNPTDLTVTNKELLVLAMQPFQQFHQES